MKTCRLFLLIIAFIIVNTVEESEFKHERWVQPGDNVDLSCQSQLIQRYQPAIKMSWSKDDTVIDHTNPRLRLDAGGNLHISSVQPDDVGIYSCLVTYWETTMTTNEIKLHVGEKTLKAEGLFGIPIPWVISGIVTVTILLGWAFVTVVTKLRKRSSGKSKKYKPLPGDEEVGFEPDEDGDNGLEDEVDDDDEV